MASGHRNNWQQKRNSGELEKTHNNTRRVARAGRSRERDESKQRTDGWTPGGGPERGPGRRRQPGRGRGGAQGGRRAPPRAACGPSLRSAGAALERLGPRTAVRTGGNPMRRCQALVPSARKGGPSPSLAVPGGGLGPRPAWVILRVPTCRPGPRGVRVRSDPEVLRGAAARPPCRADSGAPGAEAAACPLRPWAARCRVRVPPGLRGPRGPPPESPARGRPAAAEASPGPAPRRAAGRRRQGPTGGSCACLTGSRLPGNPRRLITAATVINQKGK